MKKNIFRAIAAAVLLALCFSFTACTLDVTLEGVKSRGKLIVGTDPNFPPFEFTEGRKIVGWDMDIAQAFADELGVKLKIKDMDFTSVLASVQKGSVHIGMAGISYSEERAKSVDFTDPVIDSSQMIIVKATNTDITGPMSLAGKKVGVAKGYVGEKLADLNPEWAFDDDGNAILGTPSVVSRYTSGALAVKALDNGNVDAVIMDLYPAEKFVEAYGTALKILEGSIFDDEFCFAVQKGNADLLKFLNDTIKKIKENGKMQEITDKYFGKAD